MDARITSLLERLADEAARAEELATISDDDLGALEADLLEAFRALRAASETPSAEDVATLEQIHAAVGMVRDEAGRRYEAAAIEAEEAAVRAQAAADLEASLDAPPEAEANAPAEAEAPEATEAAAAEADPDPVAEPVAEPVAAAAPRRASLAELAARRPASAAPREVVVTDQRPRWQLEGGATTTSMDEIAERFVAARESFGHSPPGFEQKVPVAKLKVDFPEDRMVGNGKSTAENDAIIAAITAGALDPATYLDPEVMAIVAAGGFCAPAEPRYDIFSVASAERPIRAGLASAGSIARGSVSFTRAPRLGTIDVSGAGAAVTVWEEATDITPGETVKTFQVIDCPTPVEVALTAIVAQVKIGNLIGRAWPEKVRNFMDLVMAAHARVAETYILDQIIAQINVDVAQTGFFGTFRDLRQVLLQASAQIRDVERMASGSRMRAIIHRNALPMLQQDLFFQTASGELDAPTVGEARVRSAVEQDANLTYAMDYSTGADAMISNSDAGGQNLADYQDNFEMPIFPEGSVAHLDGGELNLGLVRDSTLNATNDYMMFMETFENVAYFGPHALTLTLTTCPNGDSQLPVRVTTICSGS